MPRTYKNPFGNERFKSVSELERHVKKYHKNEIPKEYKGDLEHYLFDYRNDFKGGKCQVCGAPTEWDKRTKRYKVLCEPITVKRLLKDPYRTTKTFIKNKGNSCSDIARKQYIDNIRSKHNTDNLMKDEDYQKMLLNHKKSAKKVNYKGNEFIVVGSYEELFVQECNRILTRKDDLESPGPTIKYYNRVKKREAFTIWDFYIKSIDTVISIKDEGYNKTTQMVVNKRIQDVDKFDSAIGKYFGVAELNGKQEIRQFKSIYKQILHAKKSGHDNFILYPNYYDEYKNM